MANNHEQFIAFHGTITASNTKRQTLKKTVMRLEQRFVIISKSTGLKKLSPSFIGKVLTPCTPY